MKRIFWLNKTPFDSYRFYLFISVSLLLTIVAVYQISKITNGLSALNEQAPTIDFFELLPVTLIFFLFYITHKNSRTIPIRNIKTRKISWSKNFRDNRKNQVSRIRWRKDVTGKELIDTALREIYDKFNKDADSETSKLG